ncbi:stage II sporulation protein P [Pseudoflavonifractor sp. 60]|uniref:stage II sporulation protein P n=1 Tax=Pseudoflavonifractor sp. 60 TaxID=2304576 RepID=UPI00136E935C|nr:stage II sporulation protein P [Pseudoflavonifractor sp. 60]NBI65745.1 stage II sporulation protein P [Pseudoflavonifractor sp. 60]
MGNKVGRALRRGTALGLALAGVWGLSLTVDFGDAGERLETSLAVKLLTAQMGELPGTEKGLTGWGRLLLETSPLLAAGEEEVLALRGAEDSQGPEAPEVPEDPDGEEDLEEPDLRPAPEGEGIVEMTGQGKEGSQYLRDGQVYVYNRTGLELDASLLQEGTVDVSLGEGPQILILHTHGSEAYSMTDGDLYEESDPYRTTDCTHNVVRVGEEMATVFRAYGFQVIHDTTLCDYPAYNGAYDRSKAVAEQWLEQYPTIQVVLDVHRDALVGSQGEIYKMVSTEAGEKVAQVMMVLGTDAGGAAHPRWKDNLAFALTLQRSLVKGYTSLARPTVLRKSRYNQQLSPGSILVEVGGHGNTLSEAIAGGRLWADCAARTLLELKE